MNTLRAILMLDQSGAKLTDEFGSTAGASLELLFGAAVRLELDLRSAELNGSSGQLSSYPIGNFSGAEEFYFALNDSFSNSETPKYLQFDNVGVETIQGKTIFYAELPALNSTALSTALTGKETASFHCECGGADNGNPPSAVFCFQFQLTIRNRIYPGAGSAVIAGNPAYYTALETEAAIARGGTMRESTVISGGTTVTVSSGATLSNVTIDGGTLNVSSGGSAYGIHYVSGAYVSGGTILYQEA